MKRLDEIKERLDKVTHLRGNKGFDAREEFESCAEADIDYLLSLNEHYKEALKKLQRKAYIEGYAEMLYVINTEMEALEE